MPTASPPPARGRHLAEIVGDSSELLVAVTRLSARMVVLARMMLAVGFRVVRVGNTGCVDGRRDRGGFRSVVEPLPPYTPGRPPADPVARGEALYRSQGCVLCHGEGGRGGVSNPNSETGGKITGLTLVREGYTLGDLLARIAEGVDHVGRKGKRGPTPPYRMPAYGQWLTRRQREALAAYLMSLYPKDRKVEDDWDDDGDDEASEISAPPARQDASRDAGAGDGARSASVGGTP